MIMMMNTKMSTKPLVVLDAPPGQAPSPGQNYSNIVIKKVPPSVRLIQFLFRFYITGLLYSLSIN